ncbi:hypothetical protein Tco_0636610, partial [Tanacetum coccineum]
MPPLVSIDRGGGGGGICKDPKAPRAPRAPKALEEVEVVVVIQKEFLVTLISFDASYELRPGLLEVDPN